MRHGRLAGVGAAGLLLNLLLAAVAVQQAEVSQMHQSSSSTRTTPAGGVAPEDTLAAVQRLMQALQEDDAEVVERGSWNVEVRQASEHAGLGMFAARDIKAGSTILAVPVDRGFSAVTQHGVVDFLLEFVLDFYNPSSPRALFYATMPQPHKLRHQLNFPQEYLPLLQHEELEKWMGEGMHSDVKLFCELHKDVLSAANIGFDEVAHALGLLGTRSFSRPAPDGHSTIYHTLPLLDMANHVNSCPNYNTFGPCASDASRECVFFTAGADILTGQEVCYWYGHLLPDRAFLEYGFLPAAAPAKPVHKRTKKAQAAATAGQTQQQGGSAGAGDAKAAAAPSEQSSEAPKRARRVRRNRAAATEAQLPSLPLFGIDRHDFDPAMPLAKLEAEPREFTGNVDAISARIDHLQQLLDTLKAGDALADQIAAKGPAPGDAGGSFLQQVLAWRLQRQQAIEAEVKRLTRIKTTFEIRLALSGKGRQAQPGTTKPTRRTPPTARR